TRYPPRTASRSPIARPRSRLGITQRGIVPEARRYAADVSPPGARCGPWAVASARVGVGDEERLSAETLLAGAAWSGVVPCSVALIVGDNHISGRSPLVSRVIERADGNAVLPTVLVIAVPRCLQVNREGITPV